MASKVDVSKPCPYQFEPRKLTVTQDDDDDDDKEHKETEDTNIKELDWCTCNNCINMKTSDENVCCQDYTAIQEKIQEFTETRGLLEDIACITEHEGFLHNCLSIYVLERDLARMRLDKSEEEEELIHETYRHIAYRNFVLWIWHVLGKKKRVILPACVVGKIRQTFPSETDLYCGFKYPQP